MRLYRAIVHWIQSVTRINNATAAILERPDPKPKTEVLHTLPEEVANVLEMARNASAIRSRLPREYQDILEQEELGEEA